MRTHRQNCSLNKSRSWSFISRWSNSINAIRLSRNEFTARDSEVSRMLKTRSYFRRRKKQRFAWMLQKRDCESRWLHKLDSDTFERLILMSLTLNSSLRRSLSHSHIIHNLSSRSCTTFSSESRSSSWSAVSVRNSLTRHNFSEESRQSMLERLCADDGKLSAVIDPRLPLSERTRIAPRMIAR